MNNRSSIGFLTCLLATGAWACEKDDPGDSVYVRDDGTAPGVVVTSDGASIDAEMVIETTEEGGALSVEIALGARPESNVTLRVESSNESEGIVLPPELTFTPENWDQPQQLTARGVQDDIVDGDQTYQITGEIITEDVNYAALQFPVLTALNKDDDVASMDVTAAGSVTSEQGASVAVNVSLGSEPVEDVRVPLSVTEEREASTDLDELVFTATNWNVPQTVVVTGLDDDYADGDRAYILRVGAAESDDPIYAALATQDIALTNEDDDVPDVTVSPADGLVTSEDGTKTDTFTVSLSHRPVGDVTVPITSATTAEASVSVASVTFTEADWAPRVVTVTGVNDDKDDDDQPFTITVGAATGPAYEGIDPADVSGSNEDDDVRGITVSPVAGLLTQENGQGSAAVTISLDTEPLGDVSVSIPITNHAEASIAGPIVLSASNGWSVTTPVTGIDDPYADGDQPFVIGLGAASGADYEGLDAADVSGTNQDDDVASVLVSPTSGLVTSEDGTKTDTFTVSLTSRPLGDATIQIGVYGETEAFPEGIEYVEFSAANNWAPQIVTVIGQDDPYDDGDQAFSIYIDSPQGNAEYAALAGSEVTGINENDDFAAVVVDRTQLDTHELGTSDSFTVSLDVEPMYDVTIDVSVTDDTEGVLDVQSLYFSGEDWGPQTVTVTGLGEGGLDGDVTYQIVLDPSSSGDQAYAALTLPDVDVVNEDLVIRMLSDDTAQSALAGGGVTGGFVGISLVSQEQELSLLDLATGDATPTGIPLWQFDISDNAAFVVFEDQETGDILRSDMSTTPVVVSLGYDALPANGFTYDPRVSADGARVAFASQATNLHIDDSDTNADVYVRDLPSSQTLLASLNDAGEKANARVTLESISSDGGFVAIRTRATNLDARATGRQDQLFIRNLSAGTVTLASASADGLSAGDSWLVGGALSRDGLFATFMSRSSNLVAGADGTNSQIYVRSLAGGRTELATVYADGTPFVSSTSNEPDISDDANLVAFDSSDDVLEPEGEAWTGDVFVRNRSKGVTRMVSILDDSSPNPEDCWGQSLSADGRYITFVCGNVEGGPTNIWIVELDNAWWETSRVLITELLD